MKLNDYTCPLNDGQNMIQSHYLNKDLWWRVKDWGNINLVSCNGDLIFEDNKNNPFNLIFKYDTRDIKNT